MIIFIFGLGIFLSQFYIFSSGLPQPAHFLFALAFSFSAFGRGRFLVVGRQEVPVKLLYFLSFYAISINFVFAMSYFESEFVWSAIYIIFGVLVFLETRKIMIEKEGGSKILSLFALAGLIFLFVLAVLGLGEFKFFPRYNAFFNDPNQMAFWVLCVSAILLISGNFSRFLKFLVFFMAFFIIVKSASRSGLVGFVILLFGYFCGQFYEGRERFRVATVAIGIGSVIMSIGASYYFFLVNPDVFKFMLSRMDLVDVFEQADIRGYSRLWKYPEYLLFGAGHGMDDRFDVYGVEIHSTPAGIFFYYGIIGLLSFVALLYLIFSGLKMHEKIIFLAPMMYSLSTFGFRTPIFWIYLGFFYCLALNNTALRRGRRK